MSGAILKARIRAWMLGLALLLGCGLAHAEGGCPPGMIPYSGTDISSCGPIPAGYYQKKQIPQEQWITKWGAIATDESRGALGAVTGMSTREEATSSAIADCHAKGGVSCKLENWYSNGCAALVGSDTGYVVTTDEKIEQAIQSGMKTCADAGYKNCHVYYSACSPPRRIQWPLR